MGWQLARVWPLLDRTSSWRFRNECTSGKEILHLVMGACNGWTIWAFKNSCGSPVRIQIDWQFLDCLERTVGRPHDWQMDANQSSHVTADSVGYRMSRATSGMTLLEILAVVVICFVLFV